MTDRIQLVLYLRRSEASDRVVEMVLAMVREHGRSDLRVIDVDHAPEAAESDDILITPTLLRVAPAPTMRIIVGPGEDDAVRRLLEM